MSIVDKDKIAQGVRLVLEGIGEDLNREGLQGTPDRVARFYEEWLAPDFSSATFSSDGYSQLIVTRGIRFVSMCEHHMLPVIGVAHVGYIPAEDEDGRVIGLSKMVRVVDRHSRRLTIQERMTRDIIEELCKLTKPAGAMVVVEAEHYCMSMRGVHRPGHVTSTSAVKGRLQEAAPRDEFMRIVRG